jgi:hypothetical protein
MRLTGIAGAGPDRPAARTSASQGIDPRLAARAGRSHLKEVGVARLRLPAYAAATFTPAADGRIG